MARSVAIESHALVTVRQEVRLRFGVPAQQTILVQQTLPPDQVRINRQLIDKRFSCEDSEANRRGSA